jgi:predicted DNA-binding protein (MmcQ/YjbR family)
MVLPQLNRGKDFGGLGWRTPGAPVLSNRNHQFTPSRTLDGGIIEDQMNIEFVRKHCLTFPHATENVQWGNDLVFKVGGKMFAVVALEPHTVCCSLKCTPEEFAELVERPGVIPAPYLARAHWVALESFAALSKADLQRLLRDSYDQVFAKLPKKIKAAL